MYTKAEKEFYKIIEEEKKLHERRQATKDDMDKGDKGKVGLFSYLKILILEMFFFDCVSS